MGHFLGWELFEERPQTSGSLARELSKPIWLPPQQRNGERQPSREPKVNFAQLQGGYNRRSPSVPVQLAQHHQSALHWAAPGDPQGEHSPPFWVQYGVSTATQIIRSNCLHVCMK